MTTTFADLVDEVRHRTPEEQEELRRILEQARIDARRAEIAQHARESMQEEKSGSLEFTSDTSALLSKLHGA
jgi:hypothetical protein